MIESRWITRWPELFAGLTDTQVRGVVQAIDNNVLEGWEPQRADVDLLTRSARGELTDAEVIAEAVAMAAKAGVEPAACLAGINSGSGRSAISEVKPR